MFVQSSYTSVNQLFKKDQFYKTLKSNWWLLEVDLKSTMCVGEEHSKSAYMESFDLHST